MKPKSRIRRTVAELRRPLEEALSAHFGRKRRIVRLHQRISPYSSSAPIADLEVHLDTRECLALVLKDLSPDSMLATARNVRPSFLYRPEREIHLYRDVLKHSGLGTPVCYGSVESAPEQRYWLFLERVEGPLLWQVGSMVLWEDAARWLALLHNRYALDETGARPAEFEGTVVYDEPLLRTWLSRAEGFLRSKQGKQCRTRWRRFDRIASRYDRVIGRLLKMHRTLLHGEFFPSNIIVRPNSLLFPICPIDWELAGIGPDAIDLAALTLGNWRPERRTRLVAAYRAARHALDGSQPSMSELTEAVNYCQLHLSIQLLGWAADWSPPSQHTHNWLEEASHLAQAIGI